MSINLKVELTFTTYHNSESKNGQKNSTVFLESFQLASFDAKKTKPD